MAKPERPEDADVEISASARAEKMKVHIAPDSEHRPWAEPAGETAAGSERENLPGEIREGETYQRIRIDYRLASKLSADRAFRR